MDNQYTMKHKIKAMDFAILEIELYLDTHPDSQKALKARHVYREKREQYVEAYERMFGPYICTTDDVPDTADKWVWVNSPWPWESKGER